MNESVDWSRATYLFGVVVREALERAARATPPGESLHTGRVLLTLAQVDVHGNWSQFWLHANYPKPYLLLQAEDGSVHFGATWNGVPVSHDLHLAFELLHTFARAYDLSAIVPAWMVLALVAHSETGAAQALCTHSEISHEKLLDVVQEELLGSGLESLHEVIAGAPAATTSTRLNWNALSDDLDVLSALASGAHVRETSNGPLLSQVVRDYGEQARTLGTVPAQEVLRSARSIFDVPDPSAAQVLFALAEEPSPAVLGALRTAGISPSLLAAGAMEQIHDDGERPRVGTSVLVWTIVNLVLMFVVMGLVIRHALTAGSPWELVFVIPALVGPPATSAWFPGLASLALAAVLPTAGALMAVDAALSWLRQRDERRALASRTAVTLTNAEYRAWLKRRRYTAAQLARKDRLMVPFRAMRAGLQAV